VVDREREDEEKGAVLCTWVLLVWNYVLVFGPCGNPISIATADTRANDACTWSSPTTKTHCTAPSTLHITRVKEKDV
jgi:hypothetical protein